MGNFYRTPLISLADYINGYAFKPEDFSESGLPVVRIEQLKNRKAQFDLFNGIVPARNLIANGDLIFSWSASLFLQIWDRGDAILNQHLFKVVPKPNVDKTFLKYCIEYSLPELTKSAHGSTMQHITRRELAKFEVDVPKSKTEQQQIADVLARFDYAIEQTHALIAKHERVKTGLMQDLLTRGLDEDGQLRDPATHPFKDSPLGRIPAEWDFMALGCISRQITSGSRGWARYYTNDGAKFIRIGNLTRRHVNLRWNDVQHVSPPRTGEGKRTALELGDLLISITADLGIVGVVPEGIGEAYVNQHIALVKLDKDSVEPGFLGNFLASHAVQTFIANLNDAGAKAGLNLPTVASIPIVLPKREEQTAIASVFRGTDELIVSERQHLAKLHKLKTGLMQDLLTGKVSVAPLLEENHL